MKKIHITVLAVCLLLGAMLALSSCASSEYIGIVGTEINGSGELVVTYSDGSTQNLGVVVGQNGVDGTDGSLVIDNDGNGVQKASAKGLRSAVSIVCKFRATVQQGGWRPGSGSTTTKEYSSAGSGVIYMLDGVLRL